MSDSIKRNSKGKIVFQGELGAPIIRPSDAQLQIDEWSEKAGNAPFRRFPGINDEPWLAQARFGKLFALRKYFGCEHEDQWWSWFLLLYHLAAEVVPGFKVAPSGARPAGRPLGDFKEDDALVEAVAKVRETKNTSVANACCILSRRKGKWLGKDAGTLERRYRRILKERSSFSYFVEYMSDLWGLEPNIPRHREMLRAMPRLDPAELEKRIEARAKGGTKASDKTSRR